jgi:hypothetical protein
MKIGPKARIRSNLVRIIASGVLMSDDGLGVLFHVVDRCPLSTRMLNGRVDAEGLFFFLLIWRNRRRLTLWAWGFFALEEDPPTSWDCLTHFTTTWRVSNMSDMVLQYGKGCIRNRKRVKEESKEMAVFRVETITNWTYPICTGYVHPRSDVRSELDMSNLDSFKVKIIVTFGSDRNFWSNEVDKFYDILEEILPKE